MRFLRNFSTYAIADILGKSVLLLISPFLTRLLTPAQYGSLVLFNALWALVSVLQFIGMDAAFEIYRADTKDESKRALIQGSATRSVYLGFTVLWIVFFASSMTPPVRNYLGINSTEALFLTLGLIPLFITYWTTYVFRYNHLAGPFARINYLVRTICPVLSLPLLVYFSVPNRLAGFAGIVLGLQLISMLWVWREARKYKLPYLQKQYFSPELAKEMMWFGIPFIPSTILYSLTFYSDRLIVGYWLSTEKAAVIGLATQLAMFVGVIKGWFSLTWNPTMVELLATKDPSIYIPKLNSAIKFISLVFFSMTLLSKIWADDLITIIYPPSFAEVGDLIPIISLSITLSSLMLVMMATQLLKKTSKFRNWVFGGGFLLNVVVCIGTIDKLGVKSAVLGIWAAELFILISYVFIAEYVFKNLVLKIRLPILISIAMMIFISAFEFGVFFSIYVEKIGLTIIVVSVAATWVAYVAKQFFGKVGMNST